MSDVRALSSVPVTGAAASAGDAAVTLRAWRFDAQWWFGMLRTGVIVVLLVGVADYLVPGVVDRPNVAAVVSFGMAVVLMTRAMLLLPAVELGPAGLATEDRFVPWIEVASFRLTKQGRLQLVVRGQARQVEVRLATRPQRLAELERLVSAHVAGGSGRTSPRAA